MGADVRQGHFEGSRQRDLAHGLVDDHEDGFDRRPRPAGERLNVEGHLAGSLGLLG